jgi:N-acetylglucosaminyldiphosphoundecaprenol N-acetyl-beta-D-mannosaminyltransferase
MLKIDNFKITTRKLEEEVERAVKLAQFSKRTNLIQTINAHSFVVAYEDPLFKKALENADILLPDGFSISLTTRIFRLKPRINHRIAGPDFFNAFNKFANDKKFTYFFLGSSDDVLLKIVEKLNSEYPNIKVHTYAPGVYPFSEKENNLMIKKINSAKPNVLWVGMTAPKQEKWTYENREKIHVPVIASIGAAFDFYAGTRKRAPTFVQNAHMEWLYRFFLEPIRMRKRYLDNNIKFFIRMMKLRTKK